LDSGTHAFLCQKCGNRTVADHATICAVPNLLATCGHDLTDIMAATLANIPEDELFATTERKVLSR
jgi:hypothetical protein